MEVFSIIVCYQPKLGPLKELCETLSKSNSSIILVDNSEKFNPALDQLSSEVIHLGVNRGIAFAQNAGIDIAMKRGGNVFVFFDQDSVIDIDFLPELLIPLDAGIPMVVGPVFYDNARKFEYPSFKFNRIGQLKKVYRENSRSPYPVDVIISSGSAATKETFIKAGKMDEDFFIDFVDIEWAIRCRKNKIPILVVPKAVMTHSIGQKSIDMGFMTGFIHSPERTYYKLRNTFLLLRKKHVPFIFAIKEITAALVHQAIYLFFVQKRTKYMQMYLTAIYHGLTGVKGKKPSS